VHIVILGCGRVGSLLADRLDEAGHSVAVVDQDPQAFRRLGSKFGGATVKGIGFDRETLERAGIERAHAFAAVSSGDNTNILAARVARETYGVEHVVARIYDPRRAEVYQRLGIPTVATVSWPRPRKTSAMPQTPKLRISRNRRPLANQLPAPRRRASSMRISSSSDGDSSDPLCRMPRGPDMNPTGFWNARPAGAPLNA